MKHLLLILATFITLSGFSQPPFIIKLCEADSICTMNNIEDLKNYVSIHNYFYSINSDEKGNEHIFPTFDGIEYDTLSFHEIIKETNIEHIDKMDDNSLWSWRLYGTYTEWPYNSYYIYFSNSGKLYAYHLIQKGLKSQWNVKFNGILLN